MKKKILITIIAVLLILLIPIPVRLKDGGSIRFKAVVYSITKLHELSPQGSTQSYIEGIKIEIFGKEIYRKTNEGENIAANDPFSLVPLDSFADICEWSDTIVKAKYIKRESLNEYTDIFVFKVEEDFIGNVDEKRIHVYEEKENSFIQGKSYYIFMESNRNNIYPHVVYARTYANLLVGEIGKGDSQQYTFYNGVSFGLDKVDDRSKIQE